LAEQARIERGSPRPQSGRELERREGRRSDLPRTEAFPSPPKLPEASGGISSHLTAGGEARMVDVGHKAPTVRRAVAAGAVRMRPETLARVVRRDVDKGEVLATARIAGICAAKR